MGNLWHVGPQKTSVSRLFFIVLRGRRRLTTDKTAAWRRRRRGSSSSVAAEGKLLQQLAWQKKSRGFTRKSWNVSLTEHFNLHRSRVRVIVLIARRARVETFVMELVCIFNHHRAVGQHVLSTMIGQFVAIWEWATCHINFYDFSDSRLLLLLESYNTTTASLSISLAIPYTIATEQFYCCGVSCCNQHNILFFLILDWFLSTLSTHILSNW